MTKCKRINGVKSECVVMRMFSDIEDLDDELPL